MREVTTAQLRHYKEMIASGGVDAASRMYGELYGMGYNYAGWAEGVSRGNSITGLSAIDFLQDSYFSATCQYLTQDQVDQIRRDMAQRTLDEYIRIAEASGGTLSRDLRYEETKDLLIKVHDTRS